MPRYAQCNAKSNHFSFEVGAWHVVEIEISIEITNIFNHFKCVWSSMPKVIENKLAISQN